MADFRRWMTALAVIVLFVGLASAQVGTSGSSNFSPFTCSVQNVTATPNLRAEGFTELTGDIVLVCTGGTPIAVGSQIPTTNITVYYNVPAVTSRLLSTSNGVNASDALLLVDEPNGGAAGSQSGYGPSVPQISCNNPANGAGPNGCPQWVGSTLIGGGATGVPVSGSPSSTTPGANVFQGVVNGSSVQFNGIPILPPVSAGLSRVYRITNVRVNANGAGGGVAGGPGQVNASISIGGFQLTNPNPIVGYITPGLKTSIGSSSTFNQCNSVSGSFGALLNFSENFPTAFKTRVDGLTSNLLSHTSVTNNYTSSVTQNVPGTPYNSESGLIVPVVTGSGFTAGLADYGTRLKAVFNNVPAGVTVYVSTTNVFSNGGQASLQSFIQPSGTTTATSFAQLLTSETATDGTGVLPLASFTNSFTAASSSGNPTTTLVTTGISPGAVPVNYVGIQSQGQPIVFVWEVVNTQPTFSETITFSSFIAYSGVTPTFPPVGTSQVALSLAPNPTNNAFSASNGGTTAVNNLIPRFADTSTNATAVTISACSTSLLFPYITTLTGFTTGIEIANTTTDTFKTTAQSGTCALNWYQGTSNPAITTTAAIPSGTIFVHDASDPAFAGTNFSGYMIAVCNFQLAHGVAIITDIGAQRILSNYLALVLGTSRTTLPENLNN